MRAVDLSHPLESGVTVFPGDPPVDVREAATMGDDGYRVTALSASTHAGTHVDAPSHTEPHGSTIDELPVERFVFDGRILDCTHVGAREPIGAGDIPDDDDADLLVCRTGWDVHWGDDRYLDHPYLTAEAARRCVEAGWNVGLDTLNPDPTPSEASSSDEPSGVPAHRLLLGNGLLILENLTNLDAIDDTRVTLTAYPLPIAGGDGSPVRALAWLSE